MEQSQRAWNWFMEQRARISGEPIAEYLARFDRRYTAHLRTTRPVGYYGGDKVVDYVFNIVPRYGRRMTVEEFYSDDLDPELTEMRRARWARDGKVVKAYPVRGGDVGVPQSNGLVYRGMSWEEWLWMRSNHCAQSRGYYNLGDEQSGLTLFGAKADTALHYASGFAPPPYGPGWKAPGVVIGISRELVFGHDERPRALPDGEFAFEGCLELRQMVLSGLLYAWAVVPLWLSSGEQDIRQDKVARDRGGREFETGGGSWSSSGDWRVFPMSVKWF